MFVWRRRGWGWGGTGTIKNSLPVGRRSLASRWCCVWGLLFSAQAEKICGNTGKKKVVLDGPARFKKDLPVYINSLTADDAVIVIGCSREPWLGDEKSLKCVGEISSLSLLLQYCERSPRAVATCVVVALHSPIIDGYLCHTTLHTAAVNFFATRALRLCVVCDVWAWPCRKRRQCFERQLYIPFPNYPTLLQVWTEVITEQLKTVDRRLADDFDLSSLAYISVGYSCGAVVRAARATLTARRLSQVRGDCPVSFRPVTSIEWSLVTCVLSHDPFSFSLPKEMVW